MSADTSNPFHIDAYDYHLPEELIAQQPAPDRDGSRLLVVDCRTDTLQDALFPELAAWMAPGDLLLYNDTRVFPARLTGRKESGGSGEIFLLSYPREVHNGQPPTTQALLKFSKRPRPGSRLLITDQLQAAILSYNDAGQATIALHSEIPLAKALETAGDIPLPPYIKRPHGTGNQDRERYQTVFAAKTGAVAAPTAGLHITTALLDRLRRQGVATAAITLHVGYGTFAPVRTTDIRDHKIHTEEIVISPQTAALANAVRAAGNSIWCVGTTTARALEANTDPAGILQSAAGPCDIYIYPGYRFRLVDNLITNFHLPRSSLLFLVAALAGRDRILAAYAHAVAKRYRFYSYGDAMLLLGPTSRAPKTLSRRKQPA